MVGGTVTIADDGTVTGDGLSLAIFNALLAMPEYAAYLATLTPFFRVGAERGVAVLGNIIGPCVVDYITANAVVTTTIGTGDAGLQRLPHNIAEDEPTKAPASPATLTGAIT